MMGLYYPSVLSVSVYLHIFSYPPLCTASAVSLLAKARAFTVHEAAAEQHCH